MEEFTYQFIFEFHQATVSFVPKKHFYSFSSYYVFVVISFASVLAIKPCRPVLVTIMAALIAILPLALLLAFHGPPSMLVPDYGGFVPLSHLTAALSGLALGAILFLSALSKDSEAGNAGTLNIIAALLAASAVLSASFILQYWIIPAVPIEENRSSYLAWLAANLSFRFLTALAVLSMFNFLGLMRSATRKFSLIGSGLLLAIFSLLILYKQFHNILWI